MSNKNTSLDRLSEHLFDTIERVKDINDPEASPEDKINLIAAEKVSKLASQIISIAKVKLDATRLICKYDDIKGTEILQQSSLLQLEQKNV